MINLSGWKWKFAVVEERGTENEDANPADHFGQIDDGEPLLTSHNLRTYLSPISVSTIKIDEESHTSSAKIQAGPQ